MASRMDWHSSHSASGMEGHSSSMEMRSSTEVHNNMEVHGSIEKHSKVVRSRVGGCSKSLIGVGCVDVKKDSNEASSYIQFFRFIFASIVCVNLLTTSIPFAGQ